MYESEMNEVAKKAHACFKKIEVFAYSHDAKKAALAFYDIVKTTYAMAKDDDQYEKDKKDINSCLKGALMMMTMVLRVNNWTDEEMEIFENRVDELWVLDGDDKC